MEMIRFEHVNKSFGAEKVLVDFSLHIEEGEFLTVIGRSGCGKTTMLRMINGLQIPDSGKVLVEGQDVAKADLIALRRRIGYVIQNKGLFPHMTVEENITYVPVITENWHCVYCRLSGLRRRWQIDIRQSFPAVSSREWGLPELWQRMRRFC